MPLNADIGAQKTKPSPAGRRTAHPEVPVDRSFAEYWSWRHFAKRPVGDSIQAVVLVNSLIFLDIVEHEFRHPARIDPARADWGAFQSRPTESSIEHLAHYPFEELRIKEDIHEIPFQSITYDRYLPAPDAVGLKTQQTKEAFLPQQLERSVVGQDSNTEPKVGISTLLIKGSAVISALCIISIILWIGANTYILSPFSALLLLIASPFGIIMGIKILRSYPK